LNRRDWIPFPNSASSKSPPHGHQPRNGFWYDHPTSERAIVIEGPRLRNPQSSTCFRLFGGEADGAGETLGRLQQSLLGL